MHSYVHGTCMVCACVHVCVFVCTYNYVCVCVHVCVYMNPCVCMWVIVYVSVCTDTGVCGVCVRTCVYMRLKVRLSCVLRPLPHATEMYCFAVNIQLLL